MRKVTTTARATTVAATAAVAARATAAVATMAVAVTAVAVRATAAAVMVMVKAAATEMTTSGLLSTCVTLLLIEKCNHSWDEIEKSYMRRGYAVAKGRPVIDELSLYFVLFL